MRLPSLSLALTHDAKPTGSTLSSPLFTSQCAAQDTRRLPTASRPTLNLRLQVYRRPPTPKDRLPTVYLARIALCTSERTRTDEPSAQQKRPDLCRTVRRPDTRQSLLFAGSSSYRVRADCQNRRRSRTLGRRRSATIAAAPPPASSTFPGYCRRVYSFVTPRSV